MDNHKLPKNFFKNNPIARISPASLVHYQILLGLDTEEKREQDERIYELTSAEKRLEIKEEKEKIDKLQTAEEIVAIMRTNVGPLNRTSLYQKVLSMQEDVIPLMLRRYCTTLQDSFVEMAAVILAHAQLRYVENLLEMYDQIRDPYAKSIACLVIGMRKIENAAPLLLREYERMKREDTDEALSQGPLLGLYGLFDQM